MNKQILIGRLGQDPELRFTQSGDAVCNFSLATEERWSKDGERQKRTDWHRIVCWRTTAENVSKYLHKGSRVAVDGQSRTRSWEDKDGNKRYVTECVARFVEFLDPANGNGKSAADSSEGPDPLAGPDDMPDDDIPF